MGQYAQKAGAILVVGSFVLCTDVGNGFPGIAFAGVGQSGGRLGDAEPVALASGGLDGSSTAAAKSSSQPYGKPEERLRNILANGIETADELEQVIHDYWRLSFGDIVKTRFPGLRDYWYYRARADLLAKAGATEKTEFIKLLSAFYYGSVSNAKRMSSDEQIARCAAVLTVWPDAFQKYVRSEITQPQSWSLVRRSATKFRSRDQADVEVWVDLARTRDEHAIALRLLVVEEIALWIPTKYKLEAVPYEYDAAVRSSSEAEIEIPVPDAIGDGVPQPSEP